MIRASNVHQKMIRSFLYTHYWPREPSITALWMSISSNYLDVLTDKYAAFGECCLCLYFDKALQCHNLTVDVVSFG